MHPSRTCSPAHFYLKIRIAHARDIIRSSHLPITEIAMMCRGECSSCLSRCYRAVFGIPPARIALKE
ncbi:helix-turn-helix domain-containing protein [Carnimonas bestiolae]|uniref:helix-turn-helix domain-containing protein n=1 Tax=Carnimonas bestiolae TaxID=3402172 RepID=UPI003F4AE114